jgi:hypothetical protein
MEQLDEYDCFHNQGLGAAVPKGYTRRFGYTSSTTSSTTEDTKRGSWRMDCTMPLVAV